MAKDPKEPIDEKVGAYDKDKPARSGGNGTLITIILVILAVLLILWLFTDIL